MANKKIPLRQCVGCGEMKAKKELIRVIKMMRAFSWMPVDAKTEEAHIFVLIQTAWKKQENPRDLRDP